MSIIALIDKAISIPGGLKAVANRPENASTEVTSSGDPCTGALISDGLLRPIKNYIKSNNSREVCEDIVRYIIQCFKSKRNKNCCLKLLYLLDVLFARSHHCRDAVVSSLNQLTEVCGLEFKEHNKISGPGSKRQKLCQSSDEITEHIKTKCLLLLHSWDQAYGQYYPHLHVISRYMAEKGHRDLTQEREAVARQRLEKKQRALNLLQLRARKALEEARSSLPDIIDNINSLDRLFMVLYPSLDELFPPAPPVPSDRTGTGTGTGTGTDSSNCIRVVQATTTSVAVEEEDDDDELYSNIQWEDGNDSNGEGEGEGNVMGITASALTEAEATAAASRHASQLTGVGACVGASAATIGSHSSSSNRGLDYGSFGSRYYSLEITIPMGSTAVDSGLGAFTGDDDAATETHRTIVPMITELTNHLKKHAVARLGLWKGVLQLYKKYCSSEGTAGAATGSDEAVTSGNVSLSSVEVDTTLNRLQDTEDQLKHVLENKVQFLLGSSASVS